MPTATIPDISHIVSVYAFSESDKQRLATLLAKSYLLAKAQAYQKAVATTQHVARIRHPWVPGKQDATKAQTWAREQVESIANTYQELLSHAVEQALVQEERAIGDVVGKAVKAVKGWFRGFLPWKTEQIAQDTWNTGDNDGTRQWIEDIQGDDVEWEGDDPSIQDLSRFQITVIPDNSSSDFCANYAGNSYPIEEAGDIPQFPAHVGCIHGIEISVI